MIERFSSGMFHLAVERRGTGGVGRRGVYLFICCDILKMDHWDLGDILKDLWANQDDLVNINDNQEHLLNIGEEDYVNNHDDLLNIGNVNENHDDDLISIGEGSNANVNDTHDDDLMYIGDTINVNGSHDDDLRSIGEETGGWTGESKHNVEY